MALRNLSLVAASAAVLGLSSLASAAIVVNGGFETAGAGGPTDALGWSGENANVVRLPTGGVGGTAGVRLSAIGSGQASGQFSQNTGPSVVGGANGDPAPGGGMYTFSFDSLRTFGTSGVFFAQVLARDAGNNPLGGPLVNATLGGPTSTFSTFTQSFTAPAGTDRFEINFNAITGAIDPAQNPSAVVTIDNVSIVAVPEPTSLGLLGLGGLALLRRKRA